MKAEPTKKYVQAIQELMDVQYKQTDIKRSPLADMKAGKNKNGYVKICASWAKTLWAAKLSDPTEMFDNCGVNLDGGTAVARPSVGPTWKTALDFLEWYQVPLMPGFGIIIIDDENKDQYNSISGLGYDTKCFKGGMKLAVALKVLLLSSMGFIFS